MYISVKFQKYRSNHEQARTSKTPLAVGGQGDQGNTKRLVIPLRPTLPLGLTISKRCATHCSKQEQTIADH